MRKGKIEYYACGDVSEYDLDDPKEAGDFDQEIKDAGSAIDSTEFGIFEQELYEVHYYDYIAQEETVRHIYAYSPAETKLLAHLDSVYRNKEFKIEDYTAYPFSLNDAKGRDDIIGDMDLDKYREMVYDAEEKEEEE